MMAWLDDKAGVSHKKAGYVSFSDSIYFTSSFEKFISCFLDRRSIRHIEDSSTSSHWYSSKGSNLPALNP